MLSAVLVNGRFREFAVAAVSPYLHGANTPPPDLPAVAFGLYSLVKGKVVTLEPFTLVVELCATAVMTVVIRKVEQILNIPVVRVISSISIGVTMVAAVKAGLGWPNK